MSSFLDQFLGKYTLPDFILRIGIRKELADRLLQEKEKLEQNPNAKLDFIQTMNNSPVFLSTEKANEQHYEVPTEYFQLILGPYMKYSCGLWENGEKSLEDSEQSSLQEVCKNAELQNGERILELGCGWGSLTLFIAENYPDSHITAVSNSNTQRDFIQTQATKRRLDNLQVVTSDVGVLKPSGVFDKVVSVEMFEHARNYRSLLHNISDWLKPDGKLFVHIFVHQNLIYPFNTGSGSWMADYFFQDGLMPSFDIFDYFQNHFEVIQKKKINGMNYHKTCEAWLKNHHFNKAKILDLFANTYGETDKLKFWNYWKIFYLACSELFRWNQGNEWFVGHYLLKNKK